MTRSKKAKPATSAGAGTGESSAPLTQQLIPAPAPAPSTSSLIICRNKHWRYISSFHGPWLQLPPEILSSLAYSNFAAPHPRPIDPAVFFDLVSIRQHIDEATHLAVRAATTSAHAPHASAPHARLSPARKNRLRELAVSKLAAAYRLDEVAASVATMQGASTLEDVAGQILARSPANASADATYVHFFHEKIPSRTLNKSTPLTPLDTVVAAAPSAAASAPPLRTRALTRLLKDDGGGAVADLTAALAAATTGGCHGPASGGGGSGGGGGARPTGLEHQLLFHRAGAQLGLAVDAATTAGAGRTVRMLAKRSLRDYLRFLSAFEFSSPPSAVAPLSTLFTATGAETEVEAVTYHPLLTDALHSLLLAHALLSTPASDVARHARTVERVAAMADGYPIFLAARSPARADWGAVVEGWEEFRTALQIEAERTVGKGGGKGGDVMAELDREYPVSTERAGVVARWVRERGSETKRRKESESNRSGGDGGGGGGGSGTKTEIALREVLERDAVKGLEITA